MWKLISAVMVLGLLGTTMPAAAFHGSPYVLDGTAFFKPTNQLWNAKLEWGGAGIGFRVTISDPVSGVNMPIVTVQGRESLPVPPWLTTPTCPNGALEPVFPYEGIDTQTNGKLLLVNGVQENCLATGLRYMHVEGNFMQHWYLDVLTGTAFGTQYE